jgi:hypothetical protein
MCTVKFVYVSGVVAPLCSNKLFWVEGGGLLEHLKNGDQLNGTPQLRRRGKNKAQLVAQLFVLFLNVVSFFS